MVGEDHHGEWVREYFARENVPFVYDLSTLGTERHVNLMDEAGKRISIISRSGGSPERVSYGRIEPLIAWSDYIALNIVDYCRAMIPLIKSHHKEIWCDIHDYDGRQPIPPRFHQGGRLSLHELRFDARLSRLHGAHGRRMARSSWSAPTATRAPALSPHTACGSKRPRFPRMLSWTRTARATPFSPASSMVTPWATQRKCACNWPPSWQGLCITSSELALPTLSVELVEAEYARHYGGRP